MVGYGTMGNNTMTGRGILRPAHGDTFNRLAEKADRYSRRQKHYSDSTRGSLSYRVAWWVRRVMDDWFLDPIIGLAFPAAGDTISALAGLPVLHLAAVRLRSPRLVAAILFTILVDWLIGLVPAVGDVLDALHKSNKIAHRLCDGYIDRDPATLREINLRAAGLVVLVAAVVLILVFFYDLVVSAINGIAALLRR